MFKYTYFIYGETKMNKLKKIYYPILAVLFVIALCLGVVFSQVSVGAKADKVFEDNVRATMSAMNFVHNSYEPENQASVRNLIAKSGSGILDQNGIQRADGSKENGYSDAKLDKPSYVVQNVDLNSDSLADIAKNDELLFAARNLNNIVVAFPGTSEDAVLFVANYDSAPNSQSGIEGMQAATMLQTVVDLAKNYESNKPENTLVFLFTDAEHEGAYGMYAFKNQFKGFNDIASKVKLVVNFDAKGTGALAVSADGISVSEVKGMASVLTDALQVSDVTTDYDVYDTAKINVFFSGSRDYLNTTRDTVENVSSSQIKSMGGVMNSLVQAYGYGEIAGTEAEGAFSYLGMTFSYSKTVSYILGAIAIVLLIASVLEIIRNGKKASGVLRGVLAQLAALVISAVALYACYFIISYLLVGFGKIPVQAVIGIRYMNVGLFLSSLLLAFAVYTGVFMILRKAYKVKAPEAARGGALLIMLASIVMAFAMPNASLIFAITAVLEGLALLICAELSKKFKAKYNDSIEKLFVYTLPLILLTPAMLPIMITAAYTLPALYLPLILLVAVLGLTVIAPYFVLLKPALSAVVAKLPKHTIRVERTVTEQVEGAKKGRFQEVTHKKVVNEKVEWKYRNRYGITFVGILSVILVVLFAVCPANHFATNNVDEFTYREALKNDALVYVWDKQGSATAVEKLRVYDQYAYSYFATVNNDFDWNKSIGAYERDFTETNGLFGSGYTLPEISKTEDNAIRITAYGMGTESLIDVTFTKVANVTKFTIVTAGDRYEVENDGKDTFRIELPYDENEYSDFTVEFEHEGELNVGVEFNQYVSGMLTVLRMKNGSTTYKEINNNIDKSKIGSELIDEDTQDNLQKDIPCGMMFHRRDTIKID